MIWAIAGDAFFAAIAAVGFAIISNPPRKTILISALLAAVGHAFRFYLIHGPGMGIALSSLLAAFVIGLLSMFAARFVHCPAEVFSFPSLLPMIPGMYAYKTILALMQFMNASEGMEAGLVVEIFKNGLTTLFVMTALVVGVSLPLFMFPRLAYTMTRLFKLHTP